MTAPLVKPLINKVSIEDCPCEIPEIKNSYSIAPYPITSKESPSHIVESKSVVKIVVIG